MSGELSLLAGSPRAHSDLCAHGMARGQRIPPEEAPDKGRRLIRDADNLVRCLTIEIQVELGSGWPLFHLVKRFRLVPMTIYCRAFRIGFLPCLQESYRASATGRGREIGALLRVVPMNRIEIPPPSRELTRSI